MGGFEAGVRANPRAGISRNSVELADAGPQDLAPMATIGRAHVVVRPSRSGFAASLTAAFAGALRLVVPVLFLLTLGSAAFVYGDKPATFITQMSGPDHWLTLGLAMLPLTFFAVQLTARRYGFGYAFGQIVGAWVAFIALATFAQNDFLNRTGGIPYSRAFVAFGIALLVAQILSALVFHGLRGPRWWVAPLMSTVIAGMIFCLIAFPAAYAGTTGDWVNHMLTYMGYVLGSAIALLIPYWVMRPLLPPLPGFGGY